MLRFKIQTNLACCKLSTSTAHLSDSLTVIHSGRQEKALRKKTACFEIDLWKKLFEEVGQDLWIREKGKCSLIKMFMQNDLMLLESWRIRYKMTYSVSKRLTIIGRCLVPWLSYLNKKRRMQDLSVFSFSLGRSRSYLTPWITVGEWFAGDRWRTGVNAIVGGNY